MRQKVTIEVEDTDELTTLLLCIQTMKLQSLQEIIEGGEEMINVDLIHRYDSFIDQLRTQGANSPLDGLEALG